MSVRSAQVVTVEFTTRAFATGARADADSLPTGTLIINGVDNAAIVTVTNITTGRYKAAVTLPALSLNDMVEMSILATVSTITDSAVIWRDSNDGLADVEASIGTIGSGDITVITPVVSDDTVELILGDDYLAADGRSLDWTTTGSAWPSDITGAAVLMRIGDSFTKAGTVVTPTGTRHVRVELTRTETATFRARDYTFTVVLTLTSTDVITIVEGTARFNVRRRS